MRSRLLVALVSVLALAVTAAWPVRGDDEDLNWLQTKKTLRQANQALEEGRIDDAIPLFEQLLAGTDPGTDPHARALYVLGFVYLGPDRAHRNPKRGFELLQLLKSYYPEYEQHLEIAAALGWQDSLRQAQASAGRLQRQSREQDSAVQALEAEVEKLAAELAAVRQELADTQTELAEKEEALQKIRDELLGGSGG